MTTATTEGRRLKLTVEGIDEPFFVDPLPARRGRALTDIFIDASLGKLHPLATAAIFIESFGPANYARMDGTLVDEFDDDGHFLATFDAAGRIEQRQPDLGPDAVHVRFRARDDAAAPEGEPIRQEEGESLCLASFYWQTVSGMEAVNAFIDGGEGSVGSLKALNLLLFRLGVSPSKTSPSSELESQIQQQAASLSTTTPNGGSTLERLPSAKRSRLPRRERRAARKS